jgi:hypothetical protein
MKIQGYYTTDEIRARFSWSRDMVSKTARAREWRFVQVGRSKLYWATDVDGYATDRQRTELLQRTGWLKIQGSQLVRDDTYDSSCLVCGGYAVEKPPADGIEAAQPAAWLCENGHAS